MTPGSDSAPVLNERNAKQCNPCQVRKDAAAAILALFVVDHYPPILVLEESLRH